MQISVYLSDLVVDFRSTFVTIMMLLFSTILAPFLYHLWVYAGSGNANFFYAATLGFNLAQASVFHLIQIFEFDLFGTSRIPFNSFAV